MVSARPMDRPMTDMPEEILMDKGRFRGCRDHHGMSRQVGSQWVRSMREQEA